MRRRVAVLAVLGAALAVATGFCIIRANALLLAGYRLYTTTNGAQPSQKAVDTANHLIQAGSALQQLITPLATGAVLSALAVLVVLAGHRHLQELRRMRVGATS